MVHCVRLTFDRHALLLSFLWIFTLLVPSFAQESGYAQTTFRELEHKQISPEAIPDLSRSSTQDVPAAETVRTQEELPVKYWGNNYSNKFHKPSCPFAKAMNARHVVFFHLRRDAIAEGQVPCRYCLPPIIKRVQCKLLPKVELNPVEQRGDLNSPP